MKSLLLIIFFGFMHMSASEIENLASIKDEKQVVLMDDTLDYVWNTIIDKTDKQRYLQVTVESRKSKKIVSTKRYPLELLMFCESEPAEEDECNGTGIKVAKVSTHPYPFIILKAIKGAHSQVLKIYDPHKNTVEPIAEYFGAYFVNYKIDEEYIEITYDEYCDKTHPCERKVYWQ